MADRRIKPEEAALWEAATGDVKPLSDIKINQKVLIDSKEPLPIAPVKQAQKKAPVRQSVLPKAAPAKPAPAVDPAANVDKRTLMRLRRGKMEIHGRLDLHGHTRDEAHRALHAFIERAYEDQRRCVLVITGKGLRKSEGSGEGAGERERGVLRQAVPGWLSSGKLKQMIVSWQPAQPRDGGDGALYILIKRRR